MRESILINPHVCRLTISLIKQCGNVAEYERQADERLRDGMPLRVLVQFYDATMMLASILSEIEYCERKRASGTLLYCRSLPSVRVSLDDECAQLEAEIEVLSERLRTAAIASAVKTLRGKSPMAIEGQGCTFRFVEDNERHELEESLKAGSWVSAILCYYNTLTDPVQIPLTRAWY